MSPFHDLGQRCGSPVTAESARCLPSSGLMPSAKASFQIISLRRFVRLLSLSALGLTGLLSRGAGGAVFVHGSVFRISKVGSRERASAPRYAETTYSRAQALRGREC